jgi:exosortase A
VPPDQTWARRGLAVTQWHGALAGLGGAWLALFAATFSAWREMAHQWWDIDTYNHVLLVPVIIGWLVWLRRSELTRLTPMVWSPGLVLVATALCLALAGRAAGINLVEQAGVVLAFVATAVVMLGLRIAAVIAFPLIYAGFLVPFGDEIIPAMQKLTAHITVALTHVSGIPAVVDGLSIDTPGGKFRVAEECSGVKFLIAMLALSTLVAWTAFRSWRRRVALVAGAVAVSILANGVRAWGTIFVAQYVGAERAGGFDHIVYGWIFFALVIAAVLATAWRYFERDPGEAGLTAAQALALPIDRFELPTAPTATGLGVVAALSIGFAALAPLV